MTVQCGTPQGYATGCRGANCANHNTHLMTCAEAATRYAGDYQYRKQVDAGAATAAKETFAKPARATTPRIRKPSTPKKRIHREPLPHEHGTPNGYAVGCRDHCPGNNGVTCRQAASAVHLAHVQRKRALVSA